MRTTVTTVLTVGLVVVVVGALVSVGLIWALNTLFPLDIAINLKTVTATFMLALLIGGGSKSRGTGYRD